MLEEAPYPSSRQLHLHGKTSTVQRLFFVLGPTDETMGLTKKGRPTTSLPARPRNTPAPTAQEAPFRSYHYVLRIEIVAEGAIIKVDFIEGLGGEPDHLTLVEAAVLVLANDLLACSDALQGPLGTLEKTEA